MLRKLAKVASRLDSLGLTKEADIVDAEITRLAAYEFDVGAGSGIADDFESLDQPIEGDEGVDPDTVSDEEGVDAMETTEPQFATSPENKLIQMMFGRNTIMKNPLFVDQETKQLKPIEEIAAELGIDDPEVIDALESLLDSNGLYAGSGNWK